MEFSLWAKPHFKTKSTDLFGVVFSSSTVCFGGPGSGGRLWFISENVFPACASALRSRRNNLLSGQDRDCSVRPL